MSGEGGTLKVRDPGPATTVQDAGRLDARRWGVPVAGTLSPDWLFLANTLVGNPPDAAALEFRLVGPRLEIEADRILLVLGGAADLQIEGAEGPRTVAPWTAARVERGDRVTVGRLGSGATGLLAVSGGIDVPIVLGSRATYVRAALGGFHGRALQAGDRIPVGPQSNTEPCALANPPSDSPDPIRLVAGPQDDHFEPSALEMLCGGPYKVTDKVDRMGMRLDGPALTHRAPDLAQIASDGAVPGAIQVPGNGKPIVLLADGQTVGGYPKIATVISADLPRLARRSPGETVRFAVVDTDEAEAILRNHLDNLRQVAGNIVQSNASGAIDLRRLYEANLVSGVVDVGRPDHFPWNVG